MEMSHPMDDLITAINNEVQIADICRQRCFSVFELKLQINETKSKVYN